jgi:hypothetical protein
MHSVTESSLSTDLSFESTIVDTALMSSVETNSEIGVRVGFVNTQIMHKHLSTIIALLATFDDLDINRYPSKISNAVNEMSRVHAENSVHIVVMLPSRYRIDRFFGSITHRHDFYF